MGTKNNRSGVQYNPKGATQGNTLVCPSTGNPIGTIIDDEGVCRLAVDAALSAQNINVEVELDYETDGVHIGDPNTGNIIRIENDGSINTNIESDAKDGDNIAISAHPNPIFDEAVDTISSDVYEEIYSYTSTDDDTKITSIVTTVSTPSIVQVKVNGTVRKQFRTSSLERNAIFTFKEHLSLGNADILTVEACVERFLHASYDTFTSLEGYIA